MYIFIFLCTPNIVIDTKSLQLHSTSPQVAAYAASFEEVPSLQGRIQVGEICWFTKFVMYMYMIYLHI